MKVKRNPTKAEAKRGMEFWRAMLSPFKSERPEFFNRDASLEIDRLTVKTEALEEQNAELRRRLAAEHE